MADINNSTDWSETDASNNQAPPNGFPTGMFPSGVNQGMRAVMGAERRTWGRQNPIYTSTGASGVYAVTPANISFPTVYVQGEVYSFKAHQSSVGADTLNWNSLGAKNIYKPTSAGPTLLASQDIVINQMVLLAYDTTLNGGVGGWQLLTATTAGSVIPSGAMMQFGGSTAPAGWFLCNGAAVSRTGFPGLFAAIGTTFGAGDGSTTFNLPDGRGRVLAGQDPSNSTGRLTGGFSGGVSAASLANAGGEQGHALSLGELAVHAHGVNDPSHGHGFNDPSHNHGVGDPGHGHGVNDPGHVHTFNANNFAASYGQGSSSGDGGPILSINTLNTSVSGAGISIQGSGTGIFLGASGTGASVAAGGTGISIQNNGSGSGHNTVQPTLIVNHIIKI